MKLNCRNRDLHSPRRCCQEHLRDTTCIGKHADTHSLAQEELEMLEEHESHNCLGSLRHVPKGVCPIVSHAQHESACGVRAYMRISVQMSHRV